MGFRCGIVGLPNVGKSTLFKALTNNPVEASNYPFCTIDPNVGIVSVPDVRLDKLADCVNPQKKLPAVVEFVDIAGLVSGAAQGEGLGNKFLANIRETQAIAHVVRCFQDDEVVHVAGKVDPCGDIEVIQTELALADLDSVAKAILKTQKKAKAGEADAKALLAVLTRAEACLSEGGALRSQSFNDDELDLLAPYQLLTLKPVLYIANVDEDGFFGNTMLAEVQALADSEGASVVPICAKIEAELAELPAEEKTEFLADLGVDTTGLDRVIQAGYHLLGLQTFFTAGEKEVRAWTVPAGATAPQAAGVIHTDFEKGFIKAEVVAYDDFVTYGGEQGAKEAGKWRQEGRDYLVRDGDVIHFRFNV